MRSCGPVQRGKLLIQSVRAEPAQCRFSTACEQACEVMRKAGGLMHCAIPPRRRIDYNVMQEQIR